MKVFLSLALVLGAVLAEPPAYRQNRYFVARQESAPYQSRGWRPDGPAFNLPQRQQQAPDAGYGAPAQPPQNQYGPPPQQPPQNQYGPPPQQPPQNQYGPPENQYGAPARQQQQQPHQGQYRAPARQQQQQQQQQPRQQYGPPQSPQGQYGPPIQGGQYPESSAPFPSSTEYPATEYPEQQQPTTVSEFGESEAESSTPSSNSEFEEDQQDIDQPQQQEQQRSQKQEQGQYYVALPDGRLQRVQYVSRQDLEAMKYFAKIKAENVEPLRGPIYAYAPLQELEVGPGQLQVAVAAPAPSTLTVTSSERRPEKLRQPKVDVRPLAQVQYQHDNGAVAAAPVVSVNAPSAVVPLSSSYTTFTANYAQQLPATVPVEDRLILAYP